MSPRAEDEGIIHQLVRASLPVVPYLLVLLVVFVLGAIVYLFVQFQKNPEKTRLAVMLEIASLHKFGQLFTRKSDRVVTGEGEVVKPNLGQTISSPLDAKTLQALEGKPEAKP